MAKQGAAATLARPEAARPEPARRKQGLLLVPEFPADSFWSYRYILKLIGRKTAYPPLGLLTFAAYLSPDEWDLELVDLNTTSPGEDELRERIRGADVAFVSAMSIQKRSLVKILRGPARGLSTPFVLGGPFASSYRDQMLHPRTESDGVLHRGLDVLVWGEAQPALPQLLAWLDGAPVHDEAPPRLLIPGAVAQAEPGSRRYLNDRDIFQPLEDVPLPRWDLVRVNDYGSLMLQTTAGCPFRCDFCDIVQFNGGFSRPKTPQAVDRELEAIYATGFRGNVFSVDDNFIGHPTAIAGILDAMIEFQRRRGYPFNFHTQASVNLGTPELAHLLEKMQRAGFREVFLGIESPDEDALRRMNKKQNIKVDIPTAVEAIQRSGIEVYGGFIFGTDEDTPDTARRIVDFVKRTRIFTAMPGMLTPVPHTPLHERLRQEGRLRPAEFTGNNTDDDVQLLPAGMTVDEMRQGIHEILNNLFNPGEAYRRALDMVDVVRPHIFNTPVVHLAELRAAAVSFWRQGIRRLDRRYFGMLFRAWRLDQRLRHEMRAKRRRLRAALRHEHRARALAAQAERIDELLAFAANFRIRFRPDTAVAAIDRRMAELRERARAGVLSPAELRAVLQDAVACLGERIRRHRFPGLKFSRAVESALKNMYYERVVRGIMGAPPRPIRARDVVAAAAAAASAAASASAIAPLP